MKKVIFLVIIMIWVLTMFGKEFSLLEFRELPADFTGQREQVLDMDMNYCSVLRVESVEPVEISLEQNTFKTERISPGNYYLFFSSKEKKLTIQSYGYKNFEIQAPHRGFEMGMVYYLKLNTIFDVEVVINVEPKDAQIIVDGKVWNSNQGSLTPGSYELELINEGYAKLQETITIEQNKTVYNYKLLKINKEEQIVEEETEATATDSLPNVAIYDYHIKMVSCKADPNDNLTITFMVTNNGDRDRDISITGDSRFFDDKGKEYFVAKRAMGGKEQTYRYSNLNHRMIKGVPTELRIQFKDVSAAAKKVSLLELQTSDGLVPMRQIAIERF